MHNSNNSALSKDTIFGAKNHTSINSTFSSPSNLEDFSVAKAKEALKKMLLPTKEAVQVFSNLEQLREVVKIYNERTPKEQLPANITNAPNFHKVKAESVELSDCARETFTRIGGRAREAFIEEQIERANLYNIPYETYGNNYYQLMQDIDHYEYLLEKAEELGTYFDTSEYDPVFLEQIIEEREEEARNERNQLHCDYYSSRRVAL
jgi:hypothetical protein